MRTRPAGLRRGLSAGLLAVSAVTVLAAPAHAAITGTYVAGVLTVTSDAAGDSMVFTCGAAVLVNGAITAPMSAPCSAATTLVVQGNGGDDVIDVFALNGTSLNGITVDGGDGNDRVVGGGFTTGNTDQVSISGGAGDDVMIGNTSDVVKGGPGNDTITDLGIGQQIIDGEAGTDTFSYDLSTIGPQTLDFTVISGGLIVVLGGFGQILPWQSIEVVDMALNEGPNVFRADGFGGVVRVRGNGGNDTLIGSSAADVLAGGSGDDTVDGGGGADGVDAGDGNDVLRLRDSVVDSADCGAGADVVVADVGDTLAGCESVDLLPVPVPPDTTKPGVVFKKAVYKSGTIKLPASCPSELRCLGTATLAAQGKVKGKKRVVKLDTLLVVLDKGKGKTLKLRLTKAEKLAVLALDGAKLRVRYDLMDAGGNVAKGTKKVVLKLA